MTLEVALSPLLSSLLASGHSAQATEAFCFSHFGDSWSHVQCLNYSLCCSLLPRYSTGLDSPHLSGGHYKVTFSKMWNPFPEILSESPFPSPISAGVQPRQDPGGTLRMNGIGERRHVRPALIGSSLRGRERERERQTEREWPDGGCSRVWQCFIFYHSFYTPS